MTAAERALLSVRDGLEEARAALRGWYVARAGDDPEGELRELERAERALLRALAAWHEWEAAA